MENSFLLFVSTAIVALAVENAVFARGLGVDNHAVFVKNPREGILMGGVFGWVVVWSALPVSLTNYLLRGNPYVMIIRAPIYLAGVMVVYVLTHYLSGKNLKDSKLAADIQKTLPIATFNTALFAVLFLSASQNFLFSQTLGYALGSAVGYTVAIFIIYYARKRLAISAVPRSFRGLPILLIYLGLLSLALYGLIGHNLPT